MAEIMEYTVDERPIYGFEIMPEAPARPGRTYRGGGYFTHNDRCDWAWVTFWINGQKVVEARLLVGSLASLPGAIEDAIEQERFLCAGHAEPEAELTLTVEPSLHRLARNLGLSSPGELKTPWEAPANSLYLDFVPDDEEPPGTTSATPDPVEEESQAGTGEQAKETAFDITLLVDGGLIAGFGASRGGPAISMYEVDSEVLLQFARELREDLIAAGIVEPSEQEATEWEEADSASAEPGIVADEPGLLEEAEIDEALPVLRWAEHYLARLEYRRLLDDFCSYLRPDSRVLDIGCGTAEGISEALLALGYQVTAIDTWMPSLEIAACNEKLEVNWEDVRELEEEGEYDGAIAVHAFLHLDPADLSDALRAVWRTLVRNGVFLLVLDPAQELLSAPSSPDALGAMDFIADFSHGEVTASARAAGFEILHDLSIPPLEDARDWEERGRGRALILQAM